MMSGREIDVPLDSVRGLCDVCLYIANEIGIPLHFLKLLDGLRPLTSHCRLIVTDETIITVVVEQPDDDDSDRETVTTEYDTENEPGDY